MSDLAAETIAQGLNDLGSWVCLGLIVHAMISLGRR